MVPGLSASVSSGNLLEMPILTSPHTCQVRDSGGGPWQSILISPLGDYDAMNSTNLALIVTLGPSMMNRIYLRSWAVVVWRSCVKDSEA